MSDREVKLTYLSKNGEEGFPGNLNCTIIMKLTDDNAIDIQYEAETDKPTVVNMTNHSYFNLDGDPSKDNSDYLLTLNADYYTPVDSTFMTTGEIVPVEGTPMDFRLPAVIGTRINQDFEQLRYGNGIDHNWVLNTKGDIMKKKKKLTVITNSVEVLIELSGCEGIKVISTGGTLRDSSLSLVGKMAQDVLEKYYVDKAILSCKGIDLAKGVTDSHEMEADVKNCMHNCARTTILAADTSKLEHVFFVKVMDLSEGDILVLDKTPKKEWVDCLEKRGIRLITGAE